MNFEMATTVCFNEGIFFRHKKPLSNFDDKGIHHTFLSAKIKIINKHKTYLK